MLAGGCLCGSVRYEVTEPFSDLSNCHCSLCRRASGAPFVAWFTVQRTNFRLVGGPPTEFRSSPTATRSFCGTCGTALTFVLDASPDHVDVTIGSLDNPNALVPADHIHTSSQLHWIELCDGLPRFPESRAEGGPSEAPNE